MKETKSKLATVCLRGVYLFTKERIRPASVVKIVQALWEASFSFPGSLTPFCKIKCQFGCFTSSTIQVRNDVTTISLSSTKHGCMNGTFSMQFHQ